MTEKKKVTATVDEIGDFLNQTGFVFEMRMNEIFSKNGYVCEMNEMFRDLEGETDREIDLIASKNIGEIDLHFVIECKQSFLDKWIFICSKAKANRYYYSVKHLPRVDFDTIKERKLFSEFHSFDHQVPLSHNYLCFSRKNNRKGDQGPIDECIHKLPKALIDFASREQGGRNVFFPVALFSGQLFVATYAGSLIVEERTVLQHYVEFSSKPYEEEMDQLRGRAPLRFFSREEMRAVQDQRIRSTARELRPHFPIDFVTESGLPDYIKRVEKEVAAVRVEDWPIPKAET